MSGTSTSEIRQAFLDYFSRQGHQVVPSGPLVPHQNPTLLFTNAGMVPFKNVFTGMEKRDYVRAVSSQKCVRAGGKHNDLENVGYTARHHTFFEMLGNFSFGDYFKEKAIFYAWELMTKEYGLSKDRLTVTVYHEDEEAKALWKKISGLPDDRLISISTSDNFWSMGDTGPCGPCSEIFYDHGDHIFGGPPGSPDEDGDRFVEIWNLVFMQYEALSSKKRIDLPKPSIDTGMGLERVSAVLQGVHNNYDTDLFKSLIQSCEEVVCVKVTEENKASFRVIADHLRSCGFLVADGVMPSNEGRGYVLRRIMRRAMRHIHKLGARDTLMWRLVPALVEQMGAAYSELSRSQSLIQETFRLEEERFQSTLGRGLKLLDEEVSKISGKSLAGNVAFKLYDTYGFPLDLTQDILRSKELSVDEAGFDLCMEDQRAKARAAWSGSGDQGEDSLWFSLHQRHGATEFLGYTTLEAEAVVQSVIVEGEEVKTAQHKEEQDVLILVNQTPFYGESGGQAGDRGTLTFEGGQIHIKDTVKKAGNLVVHRGVIEKGTLACGQTVHLSVDGNRRQDLRLNHSATHLLHQALRETLGDQVTQKGSLVEEDRLRFDFSYGKALTSDELRHVEEKVNNLIRQNLPVDTHLMTPDQAVEQGALALFGEKYGDEVRVVSMGANGPDSDTAPSPYSVELCGGTHVKRTGDIGALKIISEASVSSGVRRIEAVTGAAVLQRLQNQEALLGRLGGLLKASFPQLEEKVNLLLKARKDLEKEVQKARQSGGNSGAERHERIVGRVRFLFQCLEDFPAGELRGLADQMKKEVGSGVVAVSSSNGDKVALVVGVTSDLSPEFSAIELVQQGAKVLGGKGGGGRPDMAQAGGMHPSKVNESMEAIAQALSKK
ncbi:MAG: alanine--tRNA ligase [bacterium]|nr:alanine--tRNA ligase [bacterium]